MHAPDGFLSAGTAVATGAISLGTVTLALRQVRQVLADRMIPLAGITAAFIFAAQMVNFPVAAGTTGHLLGGALAAVLLGPSMGALVLTVVVVVQALAFADGGLTALGYNVLNMAIVPTFGGYAAFTFFRRLFPRRAGGVIGATGLAAWASVVMSAIAFSIEWLFGATAPVPFDDVLLATVAVHALIGAGEGLISSVVVGSVLAARADLVHGASHLDRGELGDRRPITIRAFALGGLLATLVMATVVSQFAAGGPDGLQSVAESTGIDQTDSEPVFDGGVFADYATDGIADEELSLAVAGAVGALVTLAVATGMVLAVRERRTAV